MNDLYIHNENEEKVNKNDLLIKHLTMLMDGETIEKPNTGSRFSDV